MIALRELDADGIPDRTWTNRHLVYTHGYGAVASSANLVDDGEPSYLASEIPVQTELQPAPEQPGVYFGEHMSGYVVVGTKVAEQEPTVERRDGRDAVHRRRPASTRRASCARARSRCASATGTSSSPASSPTSRASSTSATSRNASVRPRRSCASTRIRIRSSSTGSILWVIDAYTISDRYPYSQSLNPSNLPDGSGLDTDFNYVRNSVKATVDAYNGTIKFYVIDSDNDGTIEDPIIHAYTQGVPRAVQRAEGHAATDCASTGAIPRTCSAPRPSSSRRTT